MWHGLFGCCCAYCHRLFGTVNPASAGWQAKVTAFDAAQMQSLWTMGMGFTKNLCASMDLAKPGLVEGCYFNKRPIPFIAPSVYQNPAILEYGYSGEIMSQVFLKATIFALSLLACAHLSAAVDPMRITPQQILKAVGNLQVQTYNVKKTAAVLVGKTFVETLVQPPEAKGSNTDSIGIKVLSRASIYFHCRDFPDGFPAGHNVYKVNTPIVGFVVEDGPEGDSYAIVTLQSCKPTAQPAIAKPAIPAPAAKPAQAAALAVPTAAAVASPSLNQTAMAPATLDDEFRDRGNTECSSGIAGLLCREKLRFALCAGKWSEAPASGQATCKNASSNPKQ